MPNLVTMTDAAAKRVLEILTKNPDSTALRVSVEGGGCSGFSYKFDLAKEPLPTDEVVTHNGATVFVDGVSLVFVAGSEIDFVDNLMEQFFKINNPNAVANCGCGTSFAV